MNRIGRQLRLVAAALVLVVGLHLPTAEGGACFSNNTELRTAAQSYVANGTNGTAVAIKYGYPISTWCVDNVTDLSNVFDGLNFTESLSGWRTGKATTMAYMFRNTPFNQPLSQFDVSRVVDFTGMFFAARSFNQNISSWDVSSAKYLTSMFDGNSSASSAFRQNLCAWGAHASSFLNVSDMFADTSCNTTADPNLRASPPGPFCSICVNSTVSNNCSLPSTCAVIVAASCTNTCNVNSTCFLNATNYCCTSPNATTAYVKNVTTVYQQAYCTRSCLTAASCADNVTKACSGTCNVTSTCFTNATNYCCTDRNATSDYVKNVTTVYQQAYCTRSCLTAARCADNVTVACSRTCFVNSTCFINATKYCCTDRNATSDYVKNVTTAYLLRNPTCNRAGSCIAPGRCASDVGTACNKTCNATSTCFVNATKACCTDGNATAAYVQNVTLAYREAYCNSSQCRRPRACARRIFRTCTEPGCGAATRCFRRTIRGCCTGRNVTSRYFARVRKRYQVINGCNRDGCIRLGVCAIRAANRCNKTCALGSSCFVNATNSCCTGGSLTSAYRAQIKARYRAQYCANVTTCTVDACAARAIRCTGRNCALNHACIRNATGSCCRPSNLTQAELLASVKTQLRRVCRRTCIPPRNPLKTCARRVKKSCRNACSNRHKSCFKRTIEGCCVKGRISMWSDLVMRKYNRKYCKGKSRRGRKFGLGLGLFP